MGKLSPISTKYLIVASFTADGIVEKSDVIGALFGQTEGLLGKDLELREVQQTGRIGRIQIEIEEKGKRTVGKIYIPSSLDKTETSLIAAAIETISRIGPCSAKVKVEEIKDIRESKREYILERAKELLKELVEKSLPDSNELIEKLEHELRASSLIEYGKDKLPAGPKVYESDEIIIVEGRADVVNLLKHGIENVIAINGTKIPESIADLASKKIVTVFVDGDRGGDLIVKSLSEIADIDFVAKAPPGREVEELSKKEIFKSLRSKIPIEQFLRETFGEEERKEEKESKGIKRLLDELIGTRGSYLLDKENRVLAKVPIKELPIVLNNLAGEVTTVVMDGTLTQELFNKIKDLGVKKIVVLRSKVKGNGIEIVTEEDLKK